MRPLQVWSALSAKRLLALSRLVGAKGFGNFLGRILNECAADEARGITKVAKLIQLLPPERQGMRGIAPVIGLPPQPITGLSAGMARAIRAINDGLNEGICASPRKPLKDMTIHDALIEDMARTDDAASCLLTYDADARGSAPRVPARTFERTAPVASESRRPQGPAAGNSTRYEPTTETAYQPAEYYDDAHAEEVGAQCERYDENDAHDYSGRDYEDSYQLRGRKLWAAAAILAVAMFGTVGAYSYRMMFGGEAQQQTAKIASVTANGDKQIQELLADRSTGERVVSREERSLTIKDPNAWALVPAVSRPLAETPPTVSAPLTTESSNVRPPPAPTGAASEPKRVRTVTMGLKGGPADAAPAPRRGLRFF